MEGKREVMRGREYSNAKTIDRGGGRHWVRVVIEGTIGMQWGDTLGVIITEGGEDILMEGDMLTSHREAGRERERTN